MSEGNDIDINIYVQSVNGSWNLGPDNPPASGIADIKVPKGTDSATIIFHLLHSQGGPNARFDAGDPIWIKPGEGGCPKKGLTKPFDLQPGAGATQFTILDDNRGKAANFTYQLNFDGMEPLDPIIRNGGGTNIV